MKKTTKKLERGVVFFFFICYTIIVCFADKTIFQTGKDDFFEIFDFSL